ncbi:MAG: AIR synthase-related protein [Planctomycetota bacterium]
MGALLVLVAASGCDSVRSDGKPSVDGDRARVQQSGNSTQGIIQHEYNFGQVPINSTNEHQFTVTNIGNISWTIKNIHRTCSCVVSSMSSKSIAPGATEEVIVKLVVGEREGRLRQDVLLEFEEPGTPLVRLRIFRRPISCSREIVGVGGSVRGLHSNGCLVRKLVFDVAGLAMDDEVPGMTGSVASTLLTPTQIYARGVRAVFRHYAVKSVVRGIAHITGGGMLENVQRILPPHVDVRIRRSSWDVPPVFTWLQGLGDVENEEMWRVFNMGIGLVLIVSSFHANAIRRILDQHQLVSWQIGEVVEGSGKTAWAD